MTGSLKRAGASTKTNTADECQNCGEKLLDAYCYACGQAAREPRRAVIGLVEDVFVDTLAIDGKLARTIGLLLWRPGVLARRYLDGKRVRYSPPFRLYLFASVFFFFAVFWATDAQVGLFRAELAETEDALAALSPDERAEVEDGLRSAQEKIEEVSPEFADFVGGTVDAPGDDSQQGEVTATDQSERVNGGEEVDNRRAPDSDESPFDLSYQGPAWFKPYASRMVEAVQRVQNDPRLFVSEIRQNLPRVLLLAPVVYGLILLLLYFYRRKYYVYDHFVISLYMHAALYSYLLIALIVSLIPGLRFFWFVPIVWGWLQPYFVFRQAYDSGRVSAWLKWAISIIVYFVAFAAIIGLGVSYALYRS